MKTLTRYHYSLLPTGLTLLSTMDLRRDNNQDDNSGGAPSPQRSVRSTMSAAMSSFASGETSTLDKTLLTNISHMSISPSSHGGNKKIQIANIDALIDQGGAKFPPPPAAANDPPNARSIPAYNAEAVAAIDAPEEGGKRLFCFGDDKKPAPFGAATSTAANAANASTATSAAAFTSPAALTDMTTAAGDHSIWNNELRARKYDEDEYVSKLADGSNMWSPPSKNDDSGRAVQAELEHLRRALAERDEQLEKQKEQLEEQKGMMECMSVQINEYQCTLGEVEEEYHLHKLQAFHEKVSISIILIFLFTPILGLGFSSHKHYTLTANSNANRGKAWKKSKHWNKSYSYEVGMDW